MRVVMQGGLGNQLFCYFAGANQAQKESRLLSLDLSELGLAKTPRTFELDKFNLPYPYTTTSKKKLKLYFRVNNFLMRYMRLNKFRRFYLSDKIGFDPVLSSVNDIKLIKGYFQTWRYADNFHTKFDLFVSSKWTSAMKELAELEKPIIVHIRRGDYVYLSEDFGLLSENYFKSGIERARRIEVHGKVWIFSDSPELISDRFINEVDGKVVTVPIGTSPAEVMSVMSLGKSIVISNSTFSWWAAFMNSNRNIVAPSKWFKGMNDPLDLYPNSWLIEQSVWQ